MTATRPHDRFTWWLEASPVLIALPILALTFLSFPFTRPVYILMLFRVYDCALRGMGVLQ